MNTCRSCGAPITWGQTITHDKPMPIDTVATDDGNIVFATDGKHCKVLTKEELAKPMTLPRFKSHFATCPNYPRRQKPRPSPEEAKAAFEAGKAEVKP